jgi:hypothetical protein
VVRTDNSEAAGAELRDVVARMRGAEFEIWIGGPGAEGVMPHVDGLPVVFVENIEEFEHRLQLSRAR